MHLVGCFGMFMFLYGMNVISEEYLTYHHILQYPV